MIGGRKPSQDTVYARELGLPNRQRGRIITQLGGAERVRAMDEDSRALLVKMVNRGDSKLVAKGGLATRGMGRLKDVRLQ